MKLKDIENQLAEASTEFYEILLKEVLSDISLFDEFMELVYEDKNPVSMRAAWLTFLVAEKYPELVFTHIPRLLEIIPEAKVDGVRRIGIKLLMLCYADLDEEQLGNLIEISFSFLENPKETISTRAYSLDILLMTTEKYPELIPEFIAVMETIMPEASVGLKHRCRKAMEKVKIH